MADPVFVRINLATPYLPAQSQPAGMQEEMEWLVENPRANFQFTFYCTSGTRHATLEPGDGYKVVITDSFNNIIAESPVVNYVEETRFGRVYKYVPNWIWKCRALSEWGDFFTITMIPNRPGREIPVVRQFVDHTDTVILQTPTYWAGIKRL